MFKKKYSKYLRYRTLDSVNIHIKKFYIAILYTWIQLLKIS